jgi:hypothetical protein
MTEATLTLDILATDEAIAREALTLEYAATTDDREKILTQCRIAAAGLAMAPEEGRDAWLKTWALELSLASARAAKPSADIDVWSELAARDGRKPDGKKVTHTALKQRAKAWEIALVWGDPTPTTIADAFRLASTTGKGAADRIAEFMARDKSEFADEAEFAREASKAASAQDGVNAKPKGGGGEPSAPTFDAATALAALEWLNKNPQSLQGEDRKRALAAVKSLANVLK